MEQAQLPRGTQIRFSRTLALALSALATVGSALACSGVGPPGKPVVFGDQTNIVIWDEAHQTEHFIRNANFKSGADSFGFIAPTPGEPHLSEASTKAFYTLAALAPPLPSAGGGLGGGGFGGFDASRSSEVRVIQEADVAGYHAATLYAEDAHAINDWMNEHGYVSTPEVEKWAERYCSRGWYLTAFKVVDKTRLKASTGTVRMSFHTQKPYNPFYVPKTNIPLGGGGTLRVYFVSVGDYDTHIGDGETWQTPQWTAPIPEATSALLAKQVKIPAEAIPDDAQVETFVDNNFPRPAADDIYFTKKPKEALLPQKPVQIPERPIPPSATIPLLVAVGALAVVGRRRISG